MTAIAASATTVATVTGTLAVTNVTRLSRARTSVSRSSCLRPWGAARVPPRDGSRYPSRVSRSCAVASFSHEATMWQLTANRAPARSDGTPHS